MEKDWGSVIDLDEYPQTSMSVSLRGCQPGEVDWYAVADEIKKAQGRIVNRYLLGELADAEKEHAKAAELYVAHCAERRRFNIGSEETVREGSDAKAGGGNAEAIGDGRQSGAGDSSPSVSERIPGDAFCPEWRLPDNKNTNEDDCLQCP